MARVRRTNLVNAPGLVSHVADLWPQDQKWNCRPNKVELSLSVALPEHVGCAFHVTRNFGEIQLG